jgi:hypothetical protein
MTQAADGDDGTLVAHLRVLGNVVTVARDTLRRTLVRRPTAGKTEIVEASPDFLDRLAERILFARGAGVLL